METEIILSYLAVLMIQNKVKTQKELLYLIDDKEIIYTMFTQWGTLNTLLKELTNSMELQF